MRKMFKAAASLAVGCAILSTSAFAALTGTPVLNENKDAVSVTVSGVEAGKESTILVLKGAYTEMPATIADSDIVYINQMTATDGTATYTMPFGTRLGDAEAVTVFAGATNEATATLLGSLTVVNKEDRDFITAADTTKATIVEKTFATVGKKYVDSSIAYATGSKKVKIKLNADSYKEASSNYLIKVVDNEGNDVTGTEIFYSVEGDFYLALIPADVVTAGYKFEVISGEDVNTATKITAFGKLSGTGKIIAKDQLAVRNAIRGTKPLATSLLFVTADVNNDGQINAKDQLAVRNKIRNQNTYQFDVLK